MKFWNDDISFRQLWPVPLPKSTCSMSPEGNWRNIFVNLPFVHDSLLETNCQMIKNGAECEWLETVASGAFFVFWFFFFWALLAVHVSLYVPRSLSKRRCCLSSSGKQNCFLYSGLGNVRDTNNLQCLQWRSELLFPSEICFYVTGGSGCLLKLTTPPLSWVAEIQHLSVIINCYKGATPSQKPQTSQIRTVCYFI